MRYAVVAIVVALLTFALLTAADAATLTESSTTTCVRHAPTRTEPGYYTIDKRWVPPRVIKGECVQWRTTTTRTVPTRKPTR